MFANFAKSFRKGIFSGSKRLRYRRSRQSSLRGFVLVGLEERVLLNAAVVTTTTPGAIMSAVQQAELGTAPYIVTFAVPPGSVFSPVSTINLTGVTVDARSVAGLVINGSNEPAGTPVIQTTGPLTSASQVFGLAIKNGSVVIGQPTDLQYFNCTNVGLTVTPTGSLLFMNSTVTQSPPWVIRGGSSFNYATFSGSNTEALDIENAPSAIFYQTSWSGYSSVGEIVGMNNVGVVYGSYITFTNDQNSYQFLEQGANTLTNLYDWQSSGDVNTAMDINSPGNVSVSNASITGNAQVVLVEGGGGIFTNSALNWNGNTGGALNMADGTFTVSNLTVNDPNSQASSVVFSPSIATSSLSITNGSVNSNVSGGYGIVANSAGGLVSIASTTVNTTNLAGGDIQLAGATASTTFNLSGVTVSGTNGIFANGLGVLNATNVNFNGTSLAFSDTGMAGTLTNPIFTNVGQVMQLSNANMTWNNPTITNSGAGATSLISEINNQPQTHSTFTVNGGTISGSSEPIVFKTNAGDVVSWSYTVLLNCAAGIQFGAAGSSGAGTAKFNFMNWRQCDAVTELTQTAGAVTLSNSSITDTNSHDTATAISMPSTSAIGESLTVLFMYVDVWAGTGGVITGTLANGASLLITESTQIISANLNVSGVNVQGSAGTGNLLSIVDSSIIGSPYCVTATGDLSVIFEASTIATYYVVVTPPNFFEIIS